MSTKYINAAATQWYEDMIKHPEKFPFSFTYGEQQYNGFDSEELVLVNKCQDCKEQKVTTDLTFRLEETLEITLKTAFYPAYGAAEWTVWFENRSTENSKVLSNLKSELTFAGERPVLKGILGDHVNKYQPYAVNLTEVPVHFYTDSGRATHINFPYFNLEYGEGGVMLAIGWAGTWQAEFVCEGNVTTYTAKSVNNLCTYLKPGEQIRSALFVRAPYQVRSDHYATNFWRSWFINCNMPSGDKSGRKLEPFSTCCLCNDTGRPNSDGSISENHESWRPSLEKMIAEDVKVDFRWFDAGWYVAPDGHSPETDWWGTIGTWELDPVKWPGRTFRESTDFARENGMKTLMWFEPERVTDPDNLVANYGYKKEWAIVREGYRNIANNIGDPECLAWTTERVCKVLRENKVEMYREDNNSNPADLWQYLDGLEGENRLGITECKFIMGHYKMWDDIIACTLSYGGCGFVDSCASGGGRNDLESMRRGVPLLRSDSDRTSTALRLSMSTAFNKWIPFCGALSREKVGELDPQGESDPYIWRASYLPALNVDSQFVYDPTQNFDMLRFGLKEWKRVAPYLLKDFYVLTPWHSEHDKSNFTAFCYYDEEAGKGAMFLFRMEKCGLDSLKVKLPFAREDKNYVFTDEDAGVSESVRGEILGKSGITFELPHKRMSRLVWVEEKPEEK